MNGSGNGPSDVDQGIETGLGLGGAISFGIGGPWGIGIGVAFLLADLAYHRWGEDKPPPPKPEHFNVPVTQPGATIPLVYGRVRITQPALSWWGGARTSPVINNDVTIGYNYFADMLFVLGIPFYNGTTRLVDDINSTGCIYYGDTKIRFFYFDGVAGVAGGSFGNPDAVIGNDLHVVGLIDFYPGGSSQDLSANGIVSTYAADGGDATLFPSYRGFAIAMLYGAGGQFQFGNSPTMAPIHFEIQSLPATFLGPASSITWEANPCDVIYDILTSPMGRYGLDPSLVWAPSFQAAAATLAAEQNGFSRSFENGASGRDCLNEILKQIDGILYEDPSDGKIHIKLVRQDYDPAACLEVNTSNCEELQGLTITSWDGLPNKIRVTFPNRVNEYNADSVSAQNQANAVGHNGDVVEIQIDTPGVCTSANATAIATRELAARSRPLARCTAIITEGFTTTVPGDVVAVTWGDYGWSGLLFRVAGVSRGTLADGRIKLQLIQEYFQVSRGAHLPPGIGSFPHTSVG